MGATSIAAISPTDVWLAGSGVIESVRRGNRTETFGHQAVAQWNGTRLNVVATPTPDPGELVGTSFTGIAAVSANDIVAVGTISGSTSNEAATLIEQWNGTSWTIISSPDPGTADNSLLGVTALGDGTVVAVGSQTNQGETPLIPQN